MFCSCNLYNKQNVTNKEKILWKHNLYNFISLKQLLKSKILAESVFALKIMKSTYAGWFKIEVMATIV